MNTIQSIKAIPFAGITYNKTAALESRAAVAPFKAE